MIKALLRPAMIFIPFALGAILPQAHRLTFMIPWFLVCMLYMVCLQLNLKELKPEPAHFKLLLLNLVMGITPYLLLKYLYPANEALAMAAFFAGITPTATAAPVVMRFLNGKVEFVVTAFVINNLGISLLLPLLLLWVTGREDAWSFMSLVCRTLLIIMLLPLILAMITRKIHPAAQMWPKKTGNFTFLMWSSMLFIMAASASEFIRNNPEIHPAILLVIAGQSAVICFFNFFIGYFCTKNLRRECSQSLGQKNTTFTMYLALTYANPLVAMGPIAYILWHNVWNAVQMFIYDRKHPDNP